VYQSVTLGDKFPNVTLKLQSNQTFGQGLRSEPSTALTVFCSLKHNYRICSYISRTRPNFILLLFAWKVHLTSTVSVSFTHRKHTWWFAIAHKQANMTARCMFAWVCMLFYGYPLSLREPSGQCRLSNDA